MSFVHPLVTPHVPIITPPGFRRNSITLTISHPISTGEVSTPISVTVSMTAYIPFPMVISTVIFTSISKSIAKSTPMTTSTTASIPAIIIVFIPIPATIPIPAPTAPPPLPSSVPTRRTTLGALRFWGRTFGRLAGKSGRFGRWLGWIWCALATLTARARPWAIPHYRGGNRVDKYEGLE